MSFFDDDFFKNPFFKKEFFGGIFYQEPFFDDTPIAHGSSGGTVDASTIRVICTRTVTGEVAFEQIEIFVEGVKAVISDVTVSGTEIDISIAPETISAGQIITINIHASDDNNIGELTNAPILNNEV